MARHETFTFRVDKQEKQMIAQLAGSLNRSQSDALRMIIREAVFQITNEQNGISNKGGNNEPNNAN